MRGTYPQKPYRKDCFGSDKSYSFHLTCGSPTRLYVLESPIDCLSHASLENLMAQNPLGYQKDGRLSLGGVSAKALEGYLKRFPSISEIVMCLDNDDAGRESSIKLAREFVNRGYRTRIELPTYKDYNEDLLNFLHKGGA
ncbi:MAG: toprim domain-containing protein [Eubacteriales bacterium]